MIPIVVLVPLALAGGGLFGLVEERFRRKRTSMQLSSKPQMDVPYSEADLGLDNNERQDAQVIMSSGDLVQIRHAEKAARIAIATSAVGLLWYPPMALVSLPIIGYSAYNWFRTRYLFEKPWYKTPLSILAILALGSSLVTGHWLVASLILSTDLAGRKWIAKWTEGSQLMMEPDSDAKKSMVPSGFMQRLKYLLRVVLQGESRWEWFPALLARLSMGLFFAISGWNKLFTVAHWKGLLAGMIATGLPFPKLLALFLAWFELVGGSLLTIGFMSTFFSIGLAFAMIVAIVTVEIPFVIPPGLGPLDWLDWFLYLPQVLYVLIFFWLIIKGPGPYSVDAMIAKKLGVDKDTDEVLRLGVDEGSDKESEDESDKEPESGGASWTPQPA